MAKRNLVLFKKTTVDPQATKQAPGALADGYLPVDYDALDQSPPDFVKPLSKTEIKRRNDLEGLITRNFKAFYDVGCALREIQQRLLYRSTHERFSDYCKELWDMARRTAYGYIEAAEVVDNVRHGAQTENVKNFRQSDAVRNCAQIENVDNCQQNSVRNCGQTETSTIVDKTMSPIGDIKMSTIGRQIDVPHGGHEPPIPKNERQARALVKFDPDQQRLVWAEALKTAPEGKITAAHIRQTARRLHLEKVRDIVTQTKKKTNQAPKISEDFRKAFNNFLDAINIERANEYKNTDQDEVIRYVRVILEALEAEL